MKTVQEIKTELEAIKTKFENELHDYIKENPYIKIGMDFSTEIGWLDCKSGERLLTSTEVKSNLNISVI